MAIATFIGIVTSAIGGAFTALGASGIGGAIAQRSFEPRQAHVQNFDRALLVDQQIGRLDVAMDHAVAVSVVERASHLGRDSHRIGDGQLVAPEFTYSSDNNAEWMSPETKVKALEKLGKFRPKIGYPDKWRDYSTLEISADDLIGNLWRIAEFDHAYAIAKIGAPVDRDEWHMTPQTVNAYYNPLMNEIVFPAAILQPPFFDMDADIAANYGGIGAVIGHEIGHGFDDQGSKYDGDGNMVDWWTDEDRAKFEELTSVLVKQFDALSPESTPDIHVNGAFTLGENIGDLGGLGIAYKAWKLALKGAESPVIDGLTGDQRFFLSYAHSWRNKNRPEEVRRRIAIDPHSPDEFRCNQIVRNVQEFYDAFGVTEKDELWLAPKERVRIW